MKKEEFQPGLQSWVENYLYCCLQSLGDIWQGNKEIVACNLFPAQKLLFCISALQSGLRH